MKHHGCAARVDECQKERAVRSVGEALNIHLVGQGARRAYSFFLRGEADDYVTQTRMERGAIYAVELGHRRQEADGARQADGSVIRVCEVEDRSQVARYGTPPRSDVSLKDS